MRHRASAKFWQFYAPGGQVATQVAWFEKTIADWNDSHEQKVELEYIPNVEYINGPKLATSFASGEGPDIFIISPGDFLRYYNGGVLQDLTPHIKPEAKADFPESVIANRMVDGKIFGVPMEVEPMAMYYSVKAFEEAKNRSLARVNEFGLSHVPAPWVPDHVRQWRALAGEDFWPYGIEPNRPTLEAFLQYGFEQGVATRRLKVEELFAPETLERAKI